MYLTDPDPTILAKKMELVDKLLSFLPRDAVIDDPRETLAYECDALSAYRCPPMVAVLPRTTEEVAKYSKNMLGLRCACRSRGSGTSLAGGALPTGDSLVLGVARMNETLEVDYPNRLMRVQTGVLI